MIPLTLEEVGRVAAGELRAGSGERVIGVSIDSRRVEPGDRVPGPVRLAGEGEAAGVQPPAEPEEARGKAQEPAEHARGVELRGEPGGLVERVLRHRAAPVTSGAATAGG